MRTIKFRGKSLYTTHEWLYGNLVELNGKYFIIPKIGKISIKQYEVIPDTIGQFTGLLDKNGVEIYEHDITKIIDAQVEDGIFTVEWSDGKELCIGFGLFSCFEYEVIGNIHES